MGAEGAGLGVWDPMGVGEAVELFSGAPFRWWITGGHALELHLGTSWRDHADLDVGICRRDAPLVHRWLAGWDVAVGAGGRLTPWQGQPLIAEQSHNNLWCRRQGDSAWRLDIAVGSGTDERWVYRRDERISRAWEETVLSTPDGVPYLAPEIQLLFKSKGLREKDNVDARHVIPRLQEVRRRRLGSWLPEAHPWQQLLARSPAPDQDLADEQPLPGGYIAGAVRVGDTVRRRPSPRAPFVHRLLLLFEQHAWAGAPRFLGIDGEGREILDHIEGHVPLGPGESSEVATDENLARVAELVRRFHDLTAGTDLAGGGEVVCHNDLSPRNTVYGAVAGALRPVALIDWDLAGPGRRIHDLAHVCWQYLDLGPTVDDVADAARRARLICDSYGLADRTHRTELVETILWWQDRCWRGIEAGAGAGDPAMVRLHGDGAVDRVRAARRWTAANRRRLEAGIG